MLIKQMNGYLVETNYCYPRSNPQTLLPRARYWKWSALRLLFGLGTRLIIKNKSYLFFITEVKKILWSRQIVFLFNFLHSLCSLVHCPSISIADSSENSSTQAFLLRPSPHTWPAHIYNAPVTHCLLCQLLHDLKREKTTIKFSRGAD